MQLSRAATLARKAQSLSLGAQSRRLAIAATCKKASDTSAVEFPAPSHVSVTGQAADLASQLAAFYSNPDSVVSLTPEARAELRAEVVKKVMAIPDSSLTEADATALQIPEKIRLGDSPLFGTFGGK